MKKIGKWNPSSWRGFPILQVPKYSNKSKLLSIEAKLKSFPPLVFAQEVLMLKKNLAKVENGDSFLFIGGDCAETFSNFNAAYIKDLFKIVMQMSIVLTFAGGKNIVKIGRFAGQFAKPRSNPFEEIGNIRLPIYRGDMINSIKFDEESREPDPSRMVIAYNQSSAMQNLVRSFSKGGFADLYRVHSWNLDFVKNSKFGKKYKKLSDQIGKTLSFMEACGITSENLQSIKETTLYSSHEALLLNYEESLTRIDSLDGGHYDCSAHMVWVGNRTKDIDGAHIEFLRGIENPLGIKIGSNDSSCDIVEVIKRLNPKNESGKIILIIRMGADKIYDALPSLIKAIKEEGLNVIWSSDPMHGNTVKTLNNYKTRDFNKILLEVKQFFEILNNHSVYPGGIHLEMTGRDVTECIGGGQEITEDRLSDRYHTFCDPRLNATQSLELAFLIAEILSKNN